MVKYNETKPSKGYSFRLQDPDIYNPASVTSSSSMSSSSYKDRIDSLFKFDDIECEQPEFTVEQLKRQLQDKLFNRQKQEEKTTEEETGRSKNFDAARSVVQAHIERIIENKSSPSKQIPAPPPLRQSPPKLESLQMPLRIIPPPEKPPIQKENIDPIPFEKMELSPPKMDLKIAARQNIPLPPIPTEVPQIKADIPSKDNRNHPVFSVDYLGSVVLVDRATSLEALQNPLKDLYFRYRSHLLKMDWTKVGTLNIESTGMRVLYQSGGQPQEILNPFPTIAVWAAVKFVYRKEITEKGSINRRFAFLPLICDPENQDKQNLFNYLATEDVELATATHPPMFACVMRKVGVAKVLECHAFICSNPEDAVVIAANLYQALLENMKIGQVQTKPQLNQDQSQVKNSVESKRENPSPDTTVSDCNFSDVDSVTPVRPPRRKKKSVGSNSEYETFQTVTRKVAFRRSQHGSNRSRSSMKGNLRHSMRSSQRGKVRRTTSERTMTSITDDSQMVTKVTIPRSKSFAANLAANSADMSAILNELKSGKGPKSVDDILKVIVNKQGMSFNELEPAYKALLLKLACTLSKDELYHKSKVIMKQQEKHKDYQSPGRFGSFLKATKRSVSRLSSKHQSSSASLKSNTSDIPNNAPERNCKSCPLPQSILKTSSLNKTQHPPTKRSTPCIDCTYDSESCFSDKCYCSSVAKRDTRLNQSECETESCGDSERCYCSIRAKTPAPRPASKPSLMETHYRPRYLRPSSELGRSSSYFSDSCDTLQSNSSSNFAINASGVRRKSSSLLGCETDSIIFASGNRFQDFSGIASFRKNSIGSDYHSNESGDSTGSARGRIMSRSAKSLSTDNLSGIGPLLTGSRGSSIASSNSGSRAGSVLSGRSVRSNGSDNAKKVLMVSAIDPSGKVLYRGAQQQATADPSNVFAMKKTAEIAALFSDLKLNTTTDIVLGSESDTDSSDDAYSSLKNSYPPQKPTYSGTNIESSLGYFP